MSKPSSKVGGHGTANLRTSITKLIARYKRKRADYHRRMMKAKDEMTAIVAGSLALAYTGAQVDLETLLCAPTPRKSRKAARVSNPKSVATKEEA